MFGYIKHDKFNFDSSEIVSEVSTLLEEAMEEDRIIFEGNITTKNLLLTETSYIRDKFVKIIEKIIFYIIRIARTFISYIDVKLKSVNTLIRRYRSQLESLVDDDLSEIEYEEIPYEINEGIPAIIDLPLIDRGIQLLETGTLSSDILSTLRNDITMELSKCRGKIMGLTGPVSEQNFDTELERLFNKVSHPAKIKMSKKILNEIVGSIDNYPKNKKHIHDHHGRVIDQLNDYKKKLSQVFNVKFSHVEDNDTVIITLNGGKKLNVDLIEAGNYREYQSLLTNFVVDVSNIHSIIFAEKLKTLKEKMEREQDVLREVILMVNKRKG